MRALDGYESRREFIEYLILLLCDIDPYFATHYISELQSVLLSGWAFPWKDSPTKMTMQILGSVLHGALGIRYQRPFKILIVIFGMVV